MVAENILLVIIIAVLIIVALIHLFHGIFVDRKMVYLEEVYSSDKIPLELDGYTLAFVTDSHGIRYKKLEKVVEHINKRGVDILLLGGDFSEHAKKTARDISLLSKVNTKNGTYGVKGNHDRRNNLFSLMKEHNMITLSNTGVQVQTGLYLAGTEDYRRGNPSIAKSIKGAKKNDFKILLAHNPDVSMLPNGEQVDLVLSGHIHGGEVSFFGLWAPLVPCESRYGWRFKGGWSKSSFGTDVYVSNGVGNHSPVRIFCPPQVIYITLKHKNSC